MPNTPEDDDKEALVDSLSEPTSGDQRVRETNTATAPAQVTAPTAPWEKGQIMGSAREGADFARLGGGFGQADTDSMKHTFGRIAQNFEHTPEGLKALVQDAEFKKLFPTATLNKDWIDFGGQFDPHTGTKVGKIDVMHAWDPEMGAGNNKNWQWLTEEDALAGAQPAAAAAPDNSAAQAALAQAIGGGGGGESDAQAQLKQMIDEAIAGEGSTLDQQALLEQLQLQA